MVLFYYKCCEVLICTSCNHYNIDHLVLSTTLKEIQEIKGSYRLEHHLELTGGVLSSLF